DYLQLARTLRVPEEMVRYFRHRESVLTAFTDQCASLPEPVLVGHFIGGRMHEAPVPQDLRHLHSLVDEPEQWNRTPLLRRMYDHTVFTGTSDDYYKILLEFAKLSRSLWHEVKTRVDRCIQRVREDRFDRPYRIECLETKCGFVF